MCGKNRRADGWEGGAAKCWILGVAWLSACCTHLSEHLERPAQNLASQNSDHKVGPLFGEELETVDGNQGTETLSFGATATRLPMLWRMVPSPCTYGLHWVDSGDYSNKIEMEEGMKLGGNMMVHKGELEHSKDGWNMIKTHCINALNFQCRNNLWKSLIFKDLTFLQDTFLLPFPEPSSGSAIFCSAHWRLACLHRLANFLTLHKSHEWAWKESRRRKGEYVPRWRSPTFREMMWLFGNVFLHFVF